jgi:hypothetical protein
MLHSGVFVARQYAAFAGITHGQKVHDFIERLLVRRLVTSMELGSTGRTRIFHVHHKPLYAAFGEPDNRNRRRVTVDRAIERLMILDGVCTSICAEAARTAGRRECDADVAHRGLHAPSAVAALPAITDAY